MQNEDVAEEKNEEKRIKTSATHISEIVGAISFKFGMQDFQATLEQNLFQSDKSHICVIFFLLIYSQCGTQASWATRQLTCVLIPKMLPGKNLFYAKYLQ